jgi:hypothetical protein
MAETGPIRALIAASILNDDPHDSAKHQEHDNSAQR